MATGRRRVERPRPAPHRDLAFRKRRQSEEVAEKVRLRKEQTIMLKAKLLQMRDQAEAQAFIAETLTAQA